MTFKKPSVDQLRSFQAAYVRYVRSLDIAEQSRLSIRQALVNLCGIQEDDNIKHISLSFRTDHHGILDEPADSLFEVLEDCVRVRERAEKRNA